MSLLNFSDIPGLAEAVNAEQVNRELAFLPMPPPICGVPVRHMNARHHIILMGCGNRCLAGGRVLPEDVAFFLWVLSPQYTTQPGFREAFIAESVRPLDFPSVVLDISTYLDRVFQDWPAPPTDGAQRKQYTAPVASIVDILATEYGWSDEAILEMPLARIFQYLRRITMRHNPRALMFNPSERVLSRYMQQRQAAANGGSN
jgi:hypothetical protein